MNVRVSRGVGSWTVAPLGDCGADLAGYLTRSTRDLAVCEAEDDPAVCGELGIGCSVAFELLAVPAVVSPAVALDHNRCPDHAEVDLAATDDRVELNRRQSIATHQLAEGRLEN